MGKNDKKYSAQKIQNNSSPIVKCLFLLIVIVINLACSVLQLPLGPNSSKENTSQQPTELLVVRNPSEWFPDPNSLETFKNVPFRKMWNRTNEEDAQHWIMENEILDMYTQNERINGVGYWWDTNCEYNENIRISSGRVDLHVFRTTEGANKFFNELPEIYINSFQRFNPDMTVTPLTDQNKIGEEAFLYTLPLSDCTDFIPKDRFLVFRRMNVVAMAGLNALAINIDGQIHTSISEEELQNKLIELGDYIDKLIVSEANQKFVMPPEETANETSDFENSGKNPRDYLEGELTCDLAGRTFSVSGSLMNNSDHLISLLIILNVTGSGSYFSSTDETVALPAKEKTDIFFSAYESVPDPYLLAPPDDPDTPEYEPEQWLELPGNSPEYSCEINSTPTWGN